MYEVSGDTVDYFHGKVGVASLLFEIGDEFLQDCNEFERRIVEDNIFALFYAAKVCRRPLKTPAGIDVKEITFANRGVVIEGQTLFVNIIMEGDNIFTTPAEDITLFIDKHPYDRPAPSGEEMTKTVPTRASASVDTTDFAAGRHFACVRVKDRKAVEGPVTCSFFEIRSRTSEVTETHHSRNRLTV